MSEFAIHADRLTKIYRLYTKPHYRFLDMFGLLPNKPGLYSEHFALDNVSISVERGERVALIGRNGAGKSTLLKIFSKVVTPTSGTIKVHGAANALLQIGSGFHPDFTGRENVISYLAQLGIDGAEAEGTVEDIISFSELEEYIDQPVKTYSSGMGARLMFAASTVIIPDILVVDEVLGVGDAYFANKSFNRIKDLCEKEGTTLFLVTHDVYSALKLCDRFIWLDQGRVVMDASGPEVIKAYEASIRLQEEKRLRGLEMKRRKELQAPTKTEGGNIVPLIGQIVRENRGAMHEAMPIAAIHLVDGEEVIDKIDMASDADKLLLSSGEGNWSLPYEREGTTYRDFSPYGSIYQRAPFTLNLPSSFFERSEPTLKLDLVDACSGVYFVELYAEGRNATSVKLPLEGDGTKKRVAVPLPLAEMGETKGRAKTLGLESNRDLADGFSLGSKRLVVERITMIDATGTDRRVLTPEEKVTVVIELTVREELFEEKVSFLLAFHKRGGGIATRVVDDDLFLKGSAGERLTVEAVMEPLLVGPGEYSVVVGLFEAHYFERQQGEHISQSSLVIDMARDALIFEVSDQSSLRYGVNYVQPARWNVQATSEPSR